MEQVAPYSTLPLSRQDKRELRSDHAGEHGAVAIYVGMLRITRDPGLRRFARRHLLAEKRHLRFFDTWLPPEAMSRLLPVWWLAGWLLGAGSAMFGPRVAYATVAAVEEFVEGHYQQQIDDMRERPALADLVSTLERFCSDEVHHREEALANGGKASSHPSFALRAWEAVVSGGSTIGVIVARRL